MDLEGRATGDDVARRLERRARETRERREVSISESRDRGRTRTDDDDGRRRFDSIRDLI
jgi:protocatechuate 3,4-dioxygenase beta subunit